MVEFVIKRCAQAGVSLTLTVDDNIDIHAKEGALTPELITLLKTNKAELILWLKNQTSVNTTSHFKQRPAIEKVDTTKAQKLSYPQEGIWLTDQIDGSVQYHLPRAFDIIGDVNYQALDKSFTQIVGRHIVLRTTYHNDDQGCGIQIVQSVPETLLQHIDITHVPNNQVDSHVAALAKTEAAKPFNLSQDILLRTSLIKRGEAHYVLLITMHHIASDAWSGGVFLRELQELYVENVKDVKSRLPQLSLQYVDYACWQRTHLEGEFFTQQLDYWRTQLAQIPTAHSLPLDFVRPKNPSYEGATVHQQIDATLKTALYALASANGTTFFMLLNAAFACLLQRYSSENDIIIGTPVANREPTEVEPLIGYFANAVVLRNSFTPNMTFIELLQQSKKNCLDAFEHQQLPFERLVNALQPERNINQNPLFQVLLALHNTKSAELVLEGAQCRTLPRESLFAQMDLSLEVFENVDGLVLRWDYAKDIFVHSTIKRMSEHFESLLNRLVSNPHEVIYNVEMLSQAERQQLVVDWNNTQADYPKDKCIHELFETQVKKYPDAIAVVFDRQQLTYQELNQKSNQLAHYLISEKNIKPDNLVGICVERSLDMIIGMLAILKAGGAYVPLDPNYPATRLAYMLQDANLSTVLTQTHLRSTTPMSDTQALCLDDVNVQQRIAIQSLDNIAPQHIGLQSNHLAYVIYTSGSTGNPKGVMVEHVSLLNTIKANANEFFIDSSSQFLQSTSLNFDAASWVIWMSLTHAAILHVASKSILLGEGIEACIQQNNITHIMMTPSFLALINPQEVKGLRVVIVGGEACDTSLMERWQSSVSFFNAYGPTETTICATTANLDKMQQVSIGKPIKNICVYVVNEHYKVTPIGVPGELLIGGSGLSRGYLNRPDLTAEKFIPNPFFNIKNPASSERLYKTGDLVRWLPDGNLEFLGRIDHQVKIRGFRIELGEIENSLSAHKLIKDAIVVAKESAAGNKYLVAYVVANNTISTEYELATVHTGLIDSLRTYLAQSLPDYMVPATFVILESLPLTPNGKVDRKALPAPDLSNSLQEYKAPSTATENILVSIWSGLLRIPAQQLSVTANFFELGGDSILSIQAVSRAAQAGLKFSVKKLFEYQTIFTLAPHVQSSHGLVDQSTVVGELPLLPIQKAFFADEVDTQHFNQAFLINTPSGFDAAALEPIITALIMRHDALRLSFEKIEGEWRAFHQPFNANWLDAIIVQCSLDNWQQLATEANVYQRSFKLSAAPLIRALYFTVENSGKLEGRLLLIAHHLIVDGVSWRILLDDIQQAYTQWQSGQVIKLGNKTTSYLAWSNWLHIYAQSEALQEERDYWQRTSNTETRILQNSSQATIADSSYITFSFDEVITQQLLTTCQQAYRTTINELLLSILLLGYQRWSGKSNLCVDLEGHGREELTADIDLTQTIGWFTSLYPLQLEMQNNALDDLICAVKENYRHIPNKGIGYGVLRYLAQDELLQSNNSADMLFNYLGQFNSVVEKSAESFSGNFDISGELTSVRRRLSHPLSINGLVEKSGRLQFILSYDAIGYTEASISAFVTAITQAQQEIVAHCLAQSVGRLTPSDFPLSNVTSVELNRLTQVYSLQDLYPATSMQEGMLFHTELDASAYTNQFQFSIKGTLALKVFKQAWQQLVDDQAVYRTCFVRQENGDLQQLVLSAAYLPWHVEDLRSLSPAAQATHIERLRQENKRQGFDLTQAPLARMCLWQLSDQEYRLLWTQHHALTDGWCLPLILENVGRYYRAFNNNQSAAVRTIYPYRHYIAWLQQQNRTSSLAYWRTNLASLERATHLPQWLSKDERAQQGSYCLQSQLSEIQTAALEQLVKTNHTTLNILLQAVWSYVLSVYSGEDVVVFATTVSGRPAELTGVEQMVGLFINTVPVCVDVGVARQTLLVDWLQQLHNAQVSRDEHSYLPLTDILSTSAVLNTAPESVLVFENYPFAASVNSEAHAAGIDIDIVGAHEETNFDLTFIATPRRGVLHIQFEGKLSRFTSAQIDQLQQSLVHVLVEIATNAQRSLSDLSVLTATEKKYLLRELNQQPCHYSQDLCIHELFEMQVEKNPGAIAVIFEVEQLTYAELNQKANQLANYLIHKRNIKPDDLVGICVERSLDMVIGILGILKAGGAYVPLDPDYPEARLHYMLHDANLGTVLTQKHLCNRMPMSDTQSLCLDDENVQQALATQSFKNIDPQQIGLHSNHLAYVIYTSGSTGNPKGVMVEHAGLINTISANANEFGVDENTVFLQSTSLNFDAASWVIWMSLAHLATLHIANNGVLLGDGVEACINNNNITHIMMTPSFLALINPEIMPRLRVAITGGEACNNTLMQTWQEHVVFFNAYGPTETTICATIAKLESSHRVSIGKPIKNTSIYIVDNNHSILPLGVAGELLIGGVGVTRGYLNRDDLTAEKFIKNPFFNTDNSAVPERLYKTGDLARWLPDGNLEFLGRIDDQVKIRGFRIELGEVEHCLCSCTGVQSVVVTAPADEFGQKTLLAYVARNNTTISSDADFIQHLRAQLKQQLPDYMVPTYFMVLEKLPLTANGKVDKRALPAVSIAEQCVDYVAPQTDIEKQLAKIWADLLRIDIALISRNANFFELGGHSLLATRLQAIVVVKYALKLEIAKLFELPQLTQLAELIDTLLLQKQIQLKHSALADDVVEVMEF